MPNENNAVVDFLNEVSEPKDIFNEKPAPERVMEDKVEEKSIPFHKDPKVQRYIQKEIEKAKKDLAPSVESQLRTVPEDIKLPSSFVKLIGNDTPEKIQVLKDMSDYFGSLKGEAKQEALNGLKEIEQEAKAKDAAALEELTSGLEQIEEDHGVNLDADEKTRAAFISFLKKASPKNAEGEVERFADIASTWELFQDATKRTSQPTRAKELAARGLTRSNDTSAAIPTGRSWKDVDKFFDKLKKQT